MQDGLQRKYEYGVLVYDGSYDVKSHYYKQDEGLHDKWHFKSQFHEQIVEYYKLYVDEGVAVYDEGDGIENEVDMDIWSVIGIEIDYK